MKFFTAAFHFGHCFNLAFNTLSRIAQGFALSSYFNQGE